MKNRARIVGVYCLVLLLGCAAVAQAQQRGRGRGFFGRGAGTLETATVDAVAAELKFSDEQSAAAKKLNDEYREEIGKALQGGDNLSQDERRARFRAVGEKRQEFEKKLAESLGDEKFKRVGQLAMQASGVSSAVFGRGNDGLTLSDEQRSQLREKLGDVGQQLQAAGEDAEARAKVVASINEKAMSILTDEQKKKWSEMIGEPASDELLGKIRAATAQRARRTT